MLLFSNNAVCYLASGMPSWPWIDPREVHLLDLTLDKFSFARVEEYTSYRMYATLSHESMPGVLEIVEIIENPGEGENYSRTSEHQMLVHRGMEGTPTPAWPAGTKVEGRVTAGMLEGFTQNSQGGSKDAISIGTPWHPSDVPSNHGFAVRVESRRIADAWLIGGLSVLQMSQDWAFGKIRRETAMEMVTPSHSVELGVVSAWEPDTDYFHGDIVSPTVPNGRQYRLVSDIEPMGCAVRSTTTEPAFLDEDDSWVESDPASAFSLAYWVCDTLGVTLELNIEQENVVLFVTEVGFICYENSATSVPIVSIGDITDPTRFVDTQPLTNATGTNTRHRFDGLPDIGVRGISYRLDTPAIGGSVKGAFYVKGLFVQTHELLPEPPPQA